MTRDPLSPQWEDCKVCTGGHWTRDHPGGEPRELTQTQYAALLEYARSGSQSKAASRRGVSLQTQKNTTSGAFRVLGVRTSIEAFLALGWLHPPEVST